jgi:beta-glucanase (GH16 family)
MATTRTAQETVNEAATADSQDESVADIRFSFSREPLGIEIDSSNNLIAVSSTPSSSPQQRQRDSAIISQSSSTVMEQVKVRCTVLVELATQSRD